MSCDQAGFGLWMRDDAMTNDGAPARQARALFRQDAPGQAVFMTAKVKGGAAIGAASIDHRRSYIKLFFQAAMHKRKETS